ncbi:unnamed protein product [Ilex paraguariensis]|uniref:Uncharacterized protein n=1 Tax=Ilex paraguariensis TaxID=185542 RepID=A0ABC8T769_9AQUA
METKEKRKRGVFGGSIWEVSMKEKGGRGQSKGLAMGVVNEAMDGSKESTQALGNVSGLLGSASAPGDSLSMVGDRGVGLRNVVHTSRGFADSDRASMGWGSPDLVAVASVVTRASDANERMGGTSSMGDAPCNKESHAIDRVEEAGLGEKEDAKLGALGGGATVLGDVNGPVRGGISGPVGGGTKWLVRGNAIGAGANALCEISREEDSGTSVVGGTDDASRRGIDRDGAHGGWQSVGDASGPLGCPRHSMGMSDRSLGRVRVASRDLGDAKVIGEASSPDGVGEGLGDAGGGSGVLVLQMGKMFFKFFFSNALPANPQEACP